MPRRNSYTPEQLAFIAARSRHMDRAQIAEEFSERFGRAVTAKAIVSTIKRERLPARDRAGINAGPKLLTPAQDAWLRVAYRQHDRNTVHQMLNRVWGLNLTRSQVKAYLKNHRILSGRTGWLTGANDPRSYTGPRKANSGCFQSGRAPSEARNYRPIGTLRLSKDGIWERKWTDEGPVHMRWRSEHSLIWEAEHGPVPDGHAVAFLDGDRENFDLRNLRCVPRGVLARMNHRRNPSGTGEARTALLLAAEIEHRANRRAGA
jgi:hypothetical protein